MPRSLIIAGLFAGGGLALLVSYVAIRLLACWISARRAERAATHDDYPHVAFEERPSHLTLLRGGKGRDGVDHYRPAYRGRN